MKAAPSPGARSSYSFPPFTRRPLPGGNSSPLSGGHNPESGAASRFNASREQAAAPWAATPMKGLNAGGSPGLPSLGGGGAPLAPPGQGGADPRDAQTAGGPVAAPMPAPGAVSAMPDEEDFNYTYMPPARHRYDFPVDQPVENKGWRYWLSLGLRAVAALSISFLAYHSDLPYLIGLTRRRRDGTYGG